MKGVLLCILCGIAVLSGCATKALMDKGKSSEMVLMVYDYENNGLQNVSVYIDDEFAGKTDINGRYLLNLPENKQYKLALEKNEYEGAGGAFLYDPFYVLYFQMGNSEQLLGLAERAMDEGGYEEAIGYLERTLAVDSRRMDALFLLAAANYKTGRADEALKALDEVTAMGGSGEYLREFRRLVVGNAVTQGSDSGQ